MLPVAPLMIEHRLIERMVALLDHELGRLGAGGPVDPAFINVALDCIRTYADRCHHGKEEDILFRELAKRQLTPEHQQIMDELVEEHAYARRMVGRLVDATERAPLDGKAGAEVLEVLRALVDLYPRHIEKEDRRFFVPVTHYFTTEEQRTMLEEMHEFDQQFIHERYRGIVEAQEALPPPSETNR